MDQQRPDEEPEVLETRPGGPGRRAWIAIAVGCCCLIVVGLAWRAIGSGQAADSKASSSPSAVDRPAGSRARSTADSPSTRTTRTADLDWLRADTGYNIFLRTLSGVVRIEPRSGRIVQTSVPQLASSGPVTFLPVRGGVLIQPLDLVAGYRVPDDDTARKTPASGGLVLPGPDDRHLWVEESGDETGFRLVDSAADRWGGRAGARIGSLSMLGDRQELISDGQGYLLGVALGRHRTYRLQPDSRTRLPIGRPIAVGPTRTLGVPGTCRSSCKVTELGPDFTTLADQPHWTINIGDFPVGTVAPDGRTAVVIGRGNVPRLIDLDSGKQISARMLQAAGPDQLAFSPDGRWLFGIADDKQAFVVDVRDGRTRVLLSEVTAVQQLAVRAATS